MRVWVRVWVRVLGAGVLCLIVIGAPTRCSYCSYFYLPTLPLYMSIGEPHISNDGTGGMATEEGETPDNLFDFAGEVVIGASWERGKQSV